MSEKRSYALWLDWPMECFRLSDAQAARFAAMAPRGAEVAVCRSRAAFLRALPSATHALVWEFDWRWFTRASRLRLLATPSAGREWMPPPSKVPPGVSVRHGAFHGAIMAETAAAFILAHARGLYRCAEMQRAGDPWPRTPLSPFCRTVAGTSAVILGYGSVGRAVGALLRKLGVRVAGVRRRNVRSLPRLLENADWLVAALPSDTGTDDMIGPELLSRLPPRAVLVNVGRGNCIDEPALVDALRRGNLAAAYLDVVKNEPLSPSSPLHPANIDGLHTAGGRRLADVLHLLPHASAFSPAYLDAFFGELRAAGCL